MNPHLSDTERTRVVELKARGYSDNTVVGLLKNVDIFINQSTVNRIWNRWKSQGTFHPEVETRGRHSLYSDHEKKLFALHILKNRSLTPKDLAHDPTINTRQASDRTMERYVNNMELKSNIAPKHPLVDETHRKL